MKPQFVEGASYEEFMAQFYPLKGDGSGTGGVGTSISAIINGTKLTVFANKKDIPFGPTTADGLIFSHQIDNRYYYTLNNDTYCFFINLHTLNTNKFLVKKDFTIKHKNTVQVFPSVERCKLVVESHKS